MDRIPALEHLRLLLAVGEEAEAARFVRELRALDGEAEALLVPVAATLLEREHCELALELALDALDVDDRCSSAHQVRVDALAEMGDIDAARSAAEEWAAIDPDCADAFVALSWARLANYDDDGAAVAATQARDLDPNAPGGWLAMAYVCRLAHEWDLLAAYCLQALDRDPSSVDAQLFLGESLVAQGRTSEGLAILAEIDDPRARAALRHMRACQAGIWLLLAGVVVLLVVGLSQGSFGVVLGASVGVGLFGRRLARTWPRVDRARGWAHWLLHPLALWAAVGLVVVAVVRSLL